MRIVSRIAAVVLCATIATSAFAADDTERTQGAIDTRQGLLKLLGFYIGPMVGMAREMIPYDGDLMKANAEKISQLAPMIPDVFRADTHESGLATGALDGIWENTDDFNGKAATLAERASALAAATAGGQGGAMKAFGAMGGACKSCHDDYREQE